MAVFRVEKTKDFTIMSNHHLRNTELSLKAKGLLSLMLSLPEDWDYTTKGLAHICKDGVDSITTALKELERHGYLTRQRLRYDNGQLGDIEYTIHEQPVSTENTGLSPKRENPRQVKPEQAKPKQAEPEQENPAQLNTNPLKTKQIQAAREADLFTYLQFHEPGVLKRDGPNFRHKEHDSLVYVTGKRYWYWNSRGRSINALDYLIQIRGYGLVDAVHALVGGEIRQEPAYRSTAEIQVSKEPEKKAFSLPWARRCATAAVSYLQKRGISSEVIRQCLQAGIFYEARYHGEPVCVFVGKDDSGKAKFACMRSIGGNLKKDVYGSDKGYNFCYPPQSPGSRHVAVFEAPIDALSHATLQELEGWKWNGYRLSLGGTSHVALTSFLERHPEIRRVTLYMDRDLAGFVNARKIKTMLHEDKRFRHIRVSVNPPRMGKDYNEKLLQVREQLQTSQHQRRPKEAAVSI